MGLTLWDLPNKWDLPDRDLPKTNILNIFITYPNNDYDIGQFELAQSGIDMFLELTPIVLYM